VEAENQASSNYGHTSLLQIDYGITASLLRHLQWDYLFRRPLGTIQGQQGIYWHRALHFFAGHEIHRDIYMVLLSAGSTLARPIGWPSRPYAFLPAELWEFIFSFWLIVMH
jgi:hypothetical protein